MNRSSTEKHLKHEQLEYDKNSLWIEQSSIKQRTAWLDIDLKSIYDDDSEKIDVNREKQLISVQGWWCFLTKDDFSYDFDWYFENIEQSDKIFWHILTSVVELFQHPSDDSYWLEQVEVFAGRAYRAFSPWLIPNQAKVLFK